MEMRSNKVMKPTRLVKQTKAAQRQAQALELVLRLRAQAVPGTDFSHALDVAVEVLSGQLRPASSEAGRRLESGMVGMLQPDLIEAVETLATSLRKIHGLVGALGRLADLMREADGIETAADAAARPAQDRIIG
jgi:hypothetical protein